MRVLVGKGFLAGQAHELERCQDCLFSVRSELEAWADRGVYMGALGCALFVNKYAQAEASVIACCRVDRKASVLGLDILLNAFSCRAPVTPCEATHVFVSLCYNLCLCPDKKNTRSL